MFYDPLLDTYVRPRTWWDITEEMSKAIERAAIKHDIQEAFKWLNVMDLIDIEAAAYWRGYGLNLYGGRSAREGR